MGEGGREQHGSKRCVDGHFRLPGCLLHCWGWLTDGPPRSQRPPPACCRHLAGVDAAYCRQRQQQLQAVRAQEAAVAQLLGVAMLYTQQDATLAPGYREALERLAAAAAERGPVGGGRYRELPIMLRPEEAGSSSSGSSREAASSSSKGGSSGSSGSGGCSSSDDLGGCTADSATGLLTAPVGVPAEALYAAVQQLGGQVLAVLGRRRQQEAELAALRTQVERKVMLRWAGAAAGRPALWGPL